MDQQKTDTRTKVWNHLDIIMPSTLLALSFALKLVVDRVMTVLDVIKSVLELPVDITFFALSLVVALAISSGGDPKLGMFLFALYVVGAIFVVLLWRRSMTHLESKKPVAYVLLGGLNYLIALSGLMVAIDLVVGGVK